MRVRGLALYPFILLQDKNDLHNIRIINHERIHHRQQLEMLLVFFYIFYLLEYLIYRFQGFEHYEAYRKLSYEQEAYANDENLNYLKTRRFWNFVRYYR